MKKWNKMKIWIVVLVISIAMLIPGVFGVSVVSEFPICTQGDIHYFPAEHIGIYGNIVVWHDSRNGNRDIYGYDLSTSTEFPICTLGSDQWNPAIYGNIVVWSDNRNGNWDIYGYDLSTSTEFPICTQGNAQCYPAIYGNIVIWNGGGSIYGYDLSTSTEFPICTWGLCALSPAIYGNIVVWFDYRDIGNPDIYGYDLSTSTEFPICTQGDVQQNPAIYGDIVVWDDYRNGGSDIYGYNLATSTEFPICTAVASQLFPTIYGNIVVWEDYRNGTVDIYGYDLSTSTEFPICTLQTQSDYPSIYGNIVVWQDYRNGQRDIYGAELGELADIRMEKIVNNPTPNVGDTVTFTITVYNDGPDTATNITVEDVIPVGYTYVAASIAGGDSRDDTGAPTLTWTINSLANGNNTALTFQAVVQAAGDYKNVAQVTASDQNDPDSTPNNDDGDQSEDDEDFTTTTPLQADLRMEKTVSNPTPNVGDTITFTITVYNDGPDTATNVSVEDIIPTGYTYVAASIAGGDSRDDTGAPTLTWTINSLANGNNTALTFQAVVQAAGNYKNVAQVTASDQYDPDSTPNNDDGDQSEDDEDFTTTTPLQADIRIEKTVNDPTPNVGDTITFTITVYNDGPDTATNITVEDVIPNGYTYVAASIAGGDSRDDTGAPTLTWTINSLANGNNTALTFQAVVQAAGDYKNVAQVTASDQNDPDSTPNNDDGDQSEDDEDFTTTTPLQADLRMEKTVSNPTPNVGDTITFTITVYNDGPDTATNVSVEDIIPTGYTYVAASIAGGDSRDDTGAPTLTWTINSLASGNNTALTFQAVVQAAGNYKNVAQVTASDQYDPDSTPNNDDGDQSEDDEDFTTTTPLQADIRIEKTVNNPTPNAGDTVTFTITVYNDGPDTATNITVEDVIPNGYTYVATSIAGGDSRDDTGAPTLTWTINSLASGNNTALTFQAVVQAAGNYKNVSQVTASDQNDPDSTPNNDDGDQSEDDEDFATTTPLQADIRIEKTVNNPTPNAGDTVTFTITVYNDGPDTATNITVEDVIPNGYTYVATSIAGGDSRDDTGAPTLTWTINSLASGNNTALTFQAVVQAAGNYKNVAQVTASDQYDPDSTPNNDDGDQSEDDEIFATTTPSPPVPPPQNPSLQNPDTNKPMRSLAAHRISQAQSILEEMQKTCTKLKDENDPLYSTCCADRLDEVIEYLEMAEKFFMSGNYIAANYWALKALALLQEIEECCQQ